MLSRWPRAALMLEGIGVVLAYAALTDALLFPLFRDPAHTVIDSLASIGWVGLPDIHLIMWVLSWDCHALATRPLRLFDANIFYPAPHALAGTDHMLGQVPIFCPVYATSGNPVLANQATLFLSIALSGAAMYALLRHWQVNRLGAFFGGVVYAFCPIRTWSVVHIHTMAGEFLPLALLFLDRAVMRASGAAAVAFGLCVLWQSLCSYYLAYVTVFAVTAYALAIVWSTRRGPLPRGLLLASVAGLIAAGVLGALSRPYVELKTIGAIWDYEQSRLVRMSSSELWRNYVYPQALMRAWGWRLMRGIPLYVGMIPSAFALCALAPGLRRRGVLPANATCPLDTAREKTAPTRGDRKMSFAIDALPFTPSNRPHLAVYRGVGRVNWRAKPPRGGAAAWARSGALAIAAVGYVMTLGPDTPVGSWTLPLPYALAMKVLPGFSSMRMPCRFAFGFFLGFAALAGIGFGRVFGFAASRHARWVGAAALVLAVLGLRYEYDLLPAHYPVRRVPVGPEVPRVYTALATLPSGPVLEIPAGGPMAQVAQDSGYDFYSIVHWHPLLNGFSGYTPPSYAALMALADALPQPRATEMLVRSTGVRYVVVHLAALPLEQRSEWLHPEGLQPMAFFGNDLLLSVFPARDADLLPATIDFGRRTTTALGTPLATLPEQGRRAQVSVAQPAPTTAVAHWFLPLKVNVSNRSERSWPALVSGDEHLVHVAYRWEGENGNVIDQSVKGARLPYDLAPGESVDLRITVPVPAMPGPRRLVIGLAQDGEWFPATAPTLLLRVQEAGREGVGHEER